MNSIISIYKPSGITPLEAVRLFQKKYPKYAESKIGYAGRLDPMADGVLLLMIGDENKNREKYQSLDKEYIVDILLGFETDTYDLLGLVTGQSSNSSLNVNYPDEGEITEVLKKFEGDITQEFPAYSSKTINGKKLFKLARNNEKVVLPKEKRRIYSIELQSLNYILGEKLEESIRSKISLVKGDFRQSEILEKWEEILTDLQNQKFSLMRIQVQSSSGTYMRTLARDIGKELGISACVFNILRTKVGDYYSNVAIPI